LNPRSPVRRPFGAVRRLLLSAAVAGTVLVTGLVAEQASRLRGGEAPPWQVQADLSLTAFEMERVGDQGVDLRLTANSAQVVETNKRLVARGIEVAFIDRDKSGPSAESGDAGGTGGAGERTGPDRSAHLSAESGEVDLNSGAIRVSGHDQPARLALADGTTFTAPALSWDPKSRTVHTEGGVAMRGAGFDAKAGDAVADVAAQSVTLSGGVRAEWTR
jgi:Lipopolysaccharide-assembly, LptC-related